MAGTTRIHSDLLRAALAPSPGCVTLEELEKLRDAALAGDPDPRVAEHVAGCVRCRAELALLDEFCEAAPRADEEADAGWIAARLDGDLARMMAPPGEPSRPAVAEKRSRSWHARIPLRHVATAVALAAALLLVVVNLRGQEVRPPPLRPDAAEAPSVFRSNAVVVIAPADDLDQPPGELRWEPFAGAASYSVVVMEVDRTEVWRGDARAPAAPLPPAVRARMVPGKPLLWQVVAKDAGGSVIATSQVQRFRVRMR